MGVNNLPAPTLHSHGVYKCRDHYHFGFLAEELNWDNEADFVPEIWWDECGPAESFKAASERFMRRTNESK